MYLQEALEVVCKKQKLNPKDYALLVADMSILVPLDRTVSFPLCPLVLLLLLFFLFFCLFWRASDRRPMN
jgi:hypothetical protein